MNTILERFKQKHEIVSDKQESIRSNHNEEEPIVLYVDDLEANLILFQEMFKNDYNILTADSGKKGLEILEKENVAVLISDQSMPEMTGNELLEIVAKKFPDIMCFILTAFTDYDSLVESVNKGKIYGYFKKPFEYEDVNISIHKAMEVYNLRVRNKEMIAELEKANRELLSIDHSKTKFLSILTNEIRSPINKIMSAVHMIKDKVESKDITELLGLLDISVSRLESFSFAANQLARLKDENRKIEQTDVSLRELLELTVISRKNALDEAGISVDFEEDAGNVSVKGDFDLLLSCVGILIMHLVNYLEEDGTITFSTGFNEQQAWLEIKVRDKKPIPGKLENLEKMLLTDAEDPDNYNSIELMLSRQIISSHKGKISISGEKDGSFNICLHFENSMN